MWQNWKFYTVIGGISAIIGLFIYGFTVDPKRVETPLLGQVAPDFEVVDLHTGETLRLSDLRGTPVLLNFWASWCVACRDEARYLQAAYELYEVQQGQLKVLGVAIQDTPEKAKAFAQQYGKTYFLGLDDAAGTISLDYGLYGVPETFYINAQGVVTYKEIGAVTPENMQPQIDRLLSGETN